MECEQARCNGKVQQSLHGFALLLAIVFRHEKNMPQAATGPE